MTNRKTVQTGRGLPKISSNTKKGWAIGARNPRLAGEKHRRKGGRQTGGGDWGGEGGGGGKKGGDLVVKVPKQ